MTPPDESSRPGKFTNAQTVLYEIDMLRFTAGSFGKERGPEEWRNLECFLLHFRNLIEFFGSDPRGDNLNIKKPEAIWGNDMPSANILKPLYRDDLWEKYEKRDPNNTAIANDKISRYLHHCTEQRTDSKNWRVREMFEELAPTISKFEELLPKESRPWKTVLDPSPVVLFASETILGTATPQRFAAFLDNPKGESERK